VGAEKDVKEKGLLRRVIIDFYIWFRNMLGKEERGGKRGLSTIFVNKSVEIGAAFSLNELIFIYFWLSAQIIGDKEMPAVSKRGVDGNHKGGTLPSRLKRA